MHDIIRRAAQVHLILALLRTTRVTIFLSENVLCGRFVNHKKQLEKLFTIIKICPKRAFLSKVCIALPKYIFENNFIDQNVGLKFLILEKLEKL